jgi:hypothetical protein
MIDCGVFVGLSWGTIFMFVWLFRIAVWGQYPDFVRDEYPTGAFALPSNTTQGTHPDDEDDEDEAEQLYRFAVSADGKKLKVVSAGDPDGAPIIGGYPAAADAEEPLKTV